MRYYQKETDCLHYHSKNKLSERIQQYKFLWNLRYAFTRAIFHNVERYALRGAGIYIISQTKFIAKQ